MKKYFVTYEKRGKRICFTMFAESEIAVASIIVNCGNKFISAKEISVV